MEMSLIVVGISTTLAGFLVGVLASMFGIGGGVIMVPLLRLLYGLPAPAASATSLTTTIPTTIASALGRAKDGSTHVRTGVLTGLAGALVSPLGAMAATNLPGVIAMSATAVIISYTAINMFRRARNMPQVERVVEQTIPSADGSVQPGPQAEAEAINQEMVGTQDSGVKRRWVVPIGVGLMTGFISGFMGISGVVIVPIYVALLKYTMKEATATSLVAVSILSIPGVIMHFIYGNVHLGIALLLMLGSLPGSRVGTILVRKVSNNKLAYAFAVMLLISGLGLILREVM